MLERIFKSECNPDTETLAWRRVDDGAIVLAATAFGCGSRIILDREDAEALARAILGLPDVSCFDWDREVAIIREHAATELLARNRTADLSEVAS